MYPIWYLQRHIPKPKTLIPTYIPNHIYPPTYPSHPCTMLSHYTKPNRGEKKNRNKVHPTFFFPPLNRLPLLFLDVPSSSSSFFFLFFSEELIRSMAKHANGLSRGSGSISLMMIGLEESFLIWGLSRVRIRIGLGPRCIETVGGDERSFGV